MMLGLGKIKRFIKRRFCNENLVVRKESICQDSTSYLDSRVEIRSFKGNKNKLILGINSGINGPSDVDIGSGQVFVGDGTRIHNGASLYGELKIGRHCSISKNFFASAGNHDMSKPSLIKYNDEHCAGSNKCIDIHDDVWVGYNVFVKQGLTIGRGAVIGACSAVTKDVFPYTVVGGVPARIIKKRFVYCPPERLDSVDPGHLPYFYSGFDQRSQSCCEEGYRVVDKSALMSLPDTFEMGSIELRANCMGEGSEFLYGDRKKARLTSKHSTVELSVNYEDVTVDCFGNKFIKLMFQNEDQIRIKGITIK